MYVYRPAGRRPHHPTTSDSIDWVTSAEAMAPGASFPASSPAGLPQPGGGGRLSPAAAGAAALAGRPAAECPVHRHNLRQQLLPVHRLDGRLRVLLGLVLHQSVALDEARPAVQVEVQVLDVAKVRKGLVHVLLLGLLVHVGHQHHPSLHRLGWPGSGGSVERLVLALRVALLPVVGALRKPAALLLLAGAAGDGRAQPRRRLLRLHRVLLVVRHSDLGQGRCFQVGEAARFLASEVACAKVAVLGP
mmetsp:Transcript_39791/g.101760  ORF Transcript_39791/g.101760 Transcript_39791/m.101760 type:complete len:247 (+) Transcript_39791:77-817(+)